MLRCQTQKIICLVVRYFSARWYSCVSRVEKQKYIFFFTKATLWFTCKLVHQYKHLLLKAFFFSKKLNKIRERMKHIRCVDKGENIKVTKMSIRLKFVVTRILVGINLGRSQFIFLRNKSFTLPFNYCPFYYFFFVKLHKHGLFIYLRKNNSIRLMSEVISLMNVGSALFQFISSMLVLVCALSCPWPTLTNVQLHT